jgi:hypothetical protein
MPDSQQEFTCDGMPAYIPDDWHMLSKEQHSEFLLIHGGHMAYGCEATVHGKLDEVLTPSERSMASEKGQWVLEHDWSDGPFIFRRYIEAIAKRPDIDRQSAPRTDE